MRRYLGLKQLLLLMPLAVLIGLHSSHAQNITLSSYSGQSEITTYNGGSITLTNGFNTAGHAVHIFVTEDTPPVANVPTSLSANQNYIATWTATAPVTDPNLLITRPLSDVKLTVQYFDGLGRPIQTVIKQGSLVTASNASADMVSMPLYDGFGRDTGTLLPYPASDAANGSYRSDPMTTQRAWYNSSNSSSPVAGQSEIGINAHSLTVYENSPLNRVLETYAPGASWVGSSKQPLENNRHGIKQKYWINTVKDSVEMFEVSFPVLGSFGNYTNAGRYEAGRLYKNVSVDETGKQVIEFKDKDGHIVLKKVQLTAAADNGTGSGHAGWLCTYYIYDDLGNLRCVVQPEGVKALQTAGWVFSSNMLSEQCFRYEYDGRSRMVIKQVPGAAAVYMVYDNRDRLVMTQDGNMRTPHKWIATKYDDLNRPSITWQYTDGSGSSLKTVLDAAAAASVYPNVTPAASTILTETHYDDYTGITLPTGMSASFIGTWNAYWLTASITAFPYAEQPAKNTQITTKGLVTWTKTAILDSTNGFLLSLTIYDDKGRVIQTQQQNITGGIDVTSTQYSWAGQPLVVVASQQAKKGTAVQTTVSVTKMTYDDLGRLVKTEQRQSNSKVGTGTMSNYATISQIGYDALGQVKRKELGKRRSTASLYTNTPLETQDYDYNIRGWLLGVNRDYARSKAYTDSANTATLTTQTFSGEMFTESSMDIQSVTFPSHNYFGFDLGYDKPNNNLIGGKTYTAPQYNGNITGMVWKDAHDSKVRKYDYTYDAASRLTGANFGQYTASNFTATKVNYSVSGLTYDENGNIKKLVRSGLLTAGSSATIDNLAYTYQPGTNKLSIVTDAILNNAGEKLGDFQDGNTSGADYSYDANGNMTIDKNKKITQIVYNILNLPREIRVNGTAGKGTIRYYYDAAGTKLRKVTIDSTTLPASRTVTTYIGGSVYQNDTLKFFGTSEGRARPDAADSFFVYDYFLKDHLGNTRMIITDDYSVSSPILETSSYYPFGLTQKGIGLIQETNPLHNKYTYNGKELQEDLGLDQYDYGKRFQDPQIGRWWVNDPKADLLEMSSPYVYCYNNPISYADPDGELAILINGRVTVGSQRGDASYWDRGIIDAIKSSGIPHGDNMMFVDGDRYYNHVLRHDIERLPGDEEGVQNGGWIDGNFAGERKEAGQVIGKADFQTILSKLARDPKTHKIIEKIEIYTHSRGAAFGTGYVDALLDLIKQNADQFADPNNEIDLVYNMAPNESGGDGTKQADGLNSYSQHHNGDPLSGSDMEGTKANFTSDEGGRFLGHHSTSSFKKDITEFTKAFANSKGDNKKLINNFLRRMQAYGIIVTVQK